jgi:hypothetical protein
VGRLARAFIEIVRLALSRDRLGTAPAPLARRRRSVLASAFARETLAVEAPPPPRPRRQVWRMLLAPEHLGSETLPVNGAGPERPRRHLARMLLAPEDLPFDPPLPRPRRSTWLRWLFAREPIDPT